MDTAREEWEHIRDNGSWEFVRGAWEFRARYGERTYITRCRTVVEQHNALCALGETIMNPVFR